MQRGPLVLLFVPLVVTAAAGLAAFWGHDLLSTRLAVGASVRVLVVLVPALAGIGGLLVLGGLWSVLDNRFFLRAHLAAAPLRTPNGKPPCHPSLPSCSVRPRMPAEGRLPGHPLPRRPTAR